MKSLGLLTLALHFVAVMMMIGSLVMIIFLNATGRSREDEAKVSASLTLSRRLPVIMTFVINLGVPPLLFAQVLYGRAIYTSSVLIAVSWFSVILLVMGAYWFIYQTSDRIAAGKVGWPSALLALILAAGVGQIYSMNMTLMLRPEVWQEMYANTAVGLQKMPADPTMTPRWLFVITGGLLCGGLWMLMVSNSKHLGDGVRSVLARFGGGMALLGGVVQAFFAFRVYAAQPDFVKSALAERPLYSVSALLFAVGTVGAMALAGIGFAKEKSSVLFATLGAVMALVANLGAVIYRDGIRDLTLLQKGFDVWARQEATNWSVVIIFLLLFVGSLFVIYWLLMVMKQATPTNESAANLPGGDPFDRAGSTVEAPKELVNL
jgi:hypothetical protein